VWRRVEKVDQMREFTSLCAPFPLYESRSSEWICTLS
jgi:hypothetical protein